MRELWPWLQALGPYRWRLLGGSALLLLTVLSGIGLLGLSGWFLTATAIAGAAGAMLNIYIPGGGIRFFALSRTVARYFERLVNHDTVLRLLADFRVRLFRGFARQPHEWRNRERTMDRLNRMTRDLDALDNLFLRLMAPVGVAFVAVVCVSALALLVDLRLAIEIAAVLLSVTALVSLGCASLTRRQARRESVGRESLRTELAASLDGMAELRAAGLLRAEHQRLLERDHALRHDQAGPAQVAVLAQGFVTLSIQGLAIWTLIRGLAAGEEAIAVFLSLSVLGVGEAISALPPAFSRWGATVASAARLNDMREPTTQPMATSPPSPEQSEALAWHNVSVRTPDGLYRLRNVSLSVRDGEKVGIVGASGSGKSTLAGLATGLIRPTEGLVMRGEKSVTPAEWQDNHLPPDTGCLTQETQLVSGTVADNLHLGDPDADEASCWWALEAAGLAETISSWREGLASWVGDEGSQLSGGEARRLALARVVISQAPLMVLDEPFTGVDRQTADRIRANLDLELPTTTCIVLAHDESALPPVDRTVRL